MLPKNRKPVHPGVILLEDFLKPLGVTPAKFAADLGGDWDEKKIQAIIEGKEKVTDKAAEAFANALQVPATFWKRLQSHHNEYEKRKMNNEKGSLKPWKKAG